MTHKVYISLVYLAVSNLKRGGGGGRGGIASHVIGRKYTEGTTLGHMRATL